MEKINLAKLARDIRDCDLKGLNAMIEAKYPGATRAEVGRAIKIAQHDLRREGAEWEREADALERLMAVVGELKPGQTVGEKLRAMAADGHERARQILARVPLRTTSAE
jgi:hypothetical protein